MSNLFTRYRWVILTILVFVFVTLFTAEFQQAQTTAVLASALRQSTPLVLGALCGVMCERSGVVNIGIEGQMLLSAFVGFMVASATGSLIAGIIAGMATGALMGASLAGLSVTLQGDQIIAGTVLNIAAFSVTTSMR